MYILHLAHLPSMLTVLQFLPSHRANLEVLQLGDGMRFPHRTYGHNCGRPNLSSEIMGSLHEGPIRKMQLQTFTVSLWWGWLPVQGPWTGRLPKAVEA